MLAVVEVVEVVEVVLVVAVVAVMEVMVVVISGSWDSCGMWHISKCEVGTSCWCNN